MAAFGAREKGCGHQRNGIKGNRIDGWQILQVKNHLSLTKNSNRAGFRGLDILLKKEDRNYPPINLKLKHKM